MESTSLALTEAPDPCGARFSTRGPVFVIDSTDAAALVHLGVMSHDRRWSRMRLVGPDGSTRRVEPAPSLVELADRFEARDVLQLNTRLAVGRWEVWLGTQLNDIELDPSPVPFLVAPVTRVDDADWEASIERSLARDRHEGGDSANAQRWTRADAVFDAATGRVSPQGATGCSSATICRSRHRSGSCCRGSAPPSGRLA